jgi:hypothetical protein
MSIAIIFICHDDNSLQSVIHYNHYILFVGNNEINETNKKYSKLIIVKDLKYNIENENKLLTFTAWYAIAKNDLFLEYKYLCVFEYDVVLKQNFYSKIITHFNINTISNLSFNKNNYEIFCKDVNMNIIIDFLKIKNINLDILPIYEWGPSTNQCVHRKVLNDFVEWYYPSCLFIKNNDLFMLSYYHERLFMIYLKINHINIVYIEDILVHLQNNSHKNGFN